MSSIAPTHPGEILLEDLMEPHGLSGHALAKILGVPANRITSIVAEKRGITADTSLRLARAFGFSPGYWLGLQSAYDIRAAEAKAKKDLKKIKPFSAEAA